MGADVLNLIHLPPVVMLLCNASQTQTGFMKRVLMQIVYVRKGRYTVKYTIY